MATQEDIESIAKNVRETIDDPHGQCFPASKSLMNELAKQTVATKDEIEIEEVRMGSNGTIRHYVVAYPAEYVDDLDVYGRVLIDITLDQYCTENEETGKVNTSIGPKDAIPSVNFYPTKEHSPYAP